MKGMVVGEPIKSMGPSKEYDEGHEKTFGEPKPFPRGRRFVWSTTEKRLVPAGYVEEKRALDAPVMVDRFYENTKSPIDGADIGSRRKHREYMKARNLTVASDLSSTWARQDAARERLRKEGALPDKSRREDIGRALHKLHPE